jgi:hypothetical protein
MYQGNVMAGCQECDTILRVKKKGWEPLKLKYLKVPQ